MSTKLTTGEKIDDLIRNAGYTAAEVARGVGVAESRISNVRNDKGTIRSDTLIKFCNFFHISADYLLGLSETQSLDISIQSVQKATGISEKAALNLTKNGYGYWPALSSILENEVFWQFLKLMETYKQVETSGDTIGDYVGAGIKSAAHCLVPEPEKEDMNIFTEEFFKAVCTRYCWILMDSYKNREGEG